MFGAGPLWYGWHVYETFHIYSNHHTRRSLPFIEFILMVGIVDIITVGSRGSGENFKFV